MKVLSYNIHKGFSPLGLRSTLGRMKTSLQQLDAELVFLQEVRGYDQRHERHLIDWPTSSQVDFLADEVWPHVAYGKNAVFAASHHGNAILSKHPIVDMVNVDVSNSRWERRGALHARVAVPGLDEPLHVVCLHLDLRESGRIRQVERLCQRIGDGVPPDAPLVVAGDFNDWRERISPILADQLGLVDVFEGLFGAPARTFPVRRPLLRMDRIYVRGLGVVGAETLTTEPWNRLSDHAAVFAELTPGFPALDPG